MGKKGKLQKYIESNEFVIRNECAISLLRTKLKIIDAQLSMKYNRQVVHSISSRIKSYESLIGKLQKKRLSGKIEVIKEKINDLAGVRVICTYTDDLYEIASALGSQKDIKILKKKDYIKSPKACGYRSLHLILELPIQFQDKEERTKVELQLRTSAMDYWAELDYHLQYKTEYTKEIDGKMVEEINRELRDYAVLIQGLDEKVLELRNKIDAL